MACELRCCPQPLTYGIVAAGTAVPPGGRIVTWYEDAPVRLPKPRTVIERQRARLVVARFACNADELRRFLDILDLWPDADPIEQ
jgi:hypothetical protein